MVVIKEGRRQRLLLNRSSIIQIETPPHPSRACQSALQLAYLRLLTITWLTQPLRLLSPSITPAPHPHPTSGSVTHYTSPAPLELPGASSSLLYLLLLGAEQPLGKQGGVGLCGVAVLFGMASANSSTSPGFS